MILIQTETIFLYCLMCFIQHHNGRTMFFFLPLGGLTAVIYTDTIQAFLMVGGGLTLMGLGNKPDFLNSMFDKCIMQHT